MEYFSRKMKILLTPIKTILGGPKKYITSWVHTCVHEMVSTQFDLFKKRVLLTKFYIMYEMLMLILNE